MVDVLSRQPLDLILSFTVSLDAATVIASVSRHFLSLLRKESTWSDVAVDARSLTESSCVHAAWPFRLCRFIRVHGAPYRLAKKYSVPVHTLWQFGPTMHITESVSSAFSGQVRNHDLEVRLSQQRLYGWTAHVQISLTLCTTITTGHFGLCTSLSPQVFLKTTLAGRWPSHLSESFLGVTLALHYENGFEHPRIVIGWDVSLWRLNRQPLDPCARAQNILLNNRTFTLALHLTRDALALHVEGVQLSSDLTFATAHTIVQKVLLRKALYPALILEADADNRDLTDQMAIIETSDIAYCDGDARDDSLRT